MPLPRFKFKFIANGANITSENHIALLNPFRYRGYMYDEETCFYYLRSRYYEPYIGRFLNADGLVSTGTGLSGYNMFAYCNNNPVVYIDSNGNIPISYDPWVTGGPSQASASPKPAQPIKITPYNYPDPEPADPINPVQNGTIQYNDYPNYPVSKKPHRGTDITGAHGAKVYSIGTGKVIEVNTNIYYNTLNNDEINSIGWNSYGTFVRVQYGDVVVVYAHLSGVAVKEGQDVFPWDLIGYVGDTGNADGYHLHFEVNDANDRNTIMDPYPYLP